MLAVQVENLVHRYGDFKALKGIHFQVPQGSLFGVVGPNGGGKSTTFKILSTLLCPTSGNVEILGKDLASQGSQIRRDLGVVFQSPALDKKLTVLENMQFQAKLYGMAVGASKAIILDLLQTVGLEKRQSDLVEVLSGGLQRRLEIAKALIHSPKLLLLDEPTTGLDPVARKEVWDYLRLLQREKGMTLMMTTHLLEEADACDAMMMIHQGEVVANGKPEDLKSQVGGNIISIRSDSAPELTQKVKEQLGCELQLVGGTLRLESEKGKVLASEILARFGEEIESLKVGHPTLEDLFLLKTGARYQSFIGEGKKS